MHPIDHFLKISQKSMPPPRIPKSIKLRSVICTTRQRKQGVLQCLSIISKVACTYRLKCSPSVLQGVHYIIRQSLLLLHMTKYNLDKHYMINAVVTFK